MIGIKASILVLSVALLLLTLLLSTCASAAWLQFQHDELNSGTTAELAPVSGVDVAWKAQVHSDDWQMAGVDIEPIVADGKVFVLDAQAYVTAFDACSGETLWETPLLQYGWQYELSTPAYADGTLYVATKGGVIYALDADSGVVLWATPLSSYTPSGVSTELNCPLTYADGKIYVGSGNYTGKTGAYYCLDADSGDVLWVRPSESGYGYYWSGAAVVGNFVVFGDWGSHLVSVFAENGSTAHEINITSALSFSRADAGRIKSSVTYNNGYVYFTSEGGYLWKVGFDESTGHFFDDGWSVEIGYSCSTPTVYDGKIYIGTGSFSIPGDVKCVDAENGDVIWSFEPNGGVKASPALSVQGDNVYVYFTTNCQNGTVYCLNGNGKPLWSFTSDEAGVSGGYILQGVSISDGYIYFGNDAACVYALKTAPVTAKVRIETPEETVWSGWVNVSDSFIPDSEGNVHHLPLPTALGALDEAAKLGNFSYTVVNTSWGLYVSEIAGVAENYTTMRFWLYRVNYELAMVGAADYVLSDGDEVLWYYGAWGGQPLRITLSASEAYVGEQLLITVEVLNDTAGVWEPASAAEILATDERGVLYELGTTNESGQAAISISVPAGLYEVYAEKESCVRSERALLLVREALPPSVDIWTDKGIYRPGDVMTLGVRMENPGVPQTVTFELFYVSGGTIFKILSAKLSLGANCTLEHSWQINVGRWSPTPFKAAFYARLFAEGGEALDSDVASWAYIPSKGLIPSDNEDSTISVLMATLRGIRW
ncbi:MAG: Outer membrane protein assembly factor BamB [Candidatus Alkanophagales archaeon MCA70_species_2]|nr:Outer membrane protein assembly factor BamB [Candidatus Alkanophaga liquidiphilum]